MTGAALLRTQLESLHLEVSEASFEDLLWLLNELFRWNRRVNLTAITDFAEAIEKHLTDSLTLLPLIDNGASLLDIGSGAGFPVLPLKLARPDLEAVSVEAAGKKIAFQKHIVRNLKLTGLITVQGRIEELNRLPEWRERFDIVVARAFAPLPVLGAAALPCLKADGRLVAMKGSEGRKELQEHGEELSRLGLSALTAESLRLPASGAKRFLLVFRRQIGGQPQAP